MGLSLNSLPETLNPELSEPYTSLLVGEAKQAGLASPLFRTDESNFHFLSGHSLSLL